MGISKLVGSDAVKRKVSDATPVKNECRSYNRGSSALEKISLRRVFQRTAADEIAAKEVEAEGPVHVVEAKSVKNDCTNSGRAAIAKIGQTVVTPVKSVCGNSFTTFAKIGYTVRVKGVYRIVHWMTGDGTKSTTGIYATNFAQNAELHESKDGDELIPGGGAAPTGCITVKNACTNSCTYDTVAFTNSGQAFAMPGKKECMNSYTFGFITFAKIGYVVRINVSRVGQWMSDDDNKNNIIMYSTMFAINACLLQDYYKLIPGGVGVAIFIILSNTLIDILREYKKVSKEKAGSPLKHLIDYLKNEVGVSSMKDFFFLLLNELIAFVRQLRQVPFPTQFSSKEVLTMESLVFMTRDFFVFMMERNITPSLRRMKRQFGTQFLTQKDEIVVTAVRELSSVGGFHESSTKGKKKEREAELLLGLLALLHRMTGVKFT